MPVTRLHVGVNLAKTAVVGLSIIRISQERLITAISIELIKSYRGIVPLLRVKAACVEGFERLRDKSRNILQ